MAAKTLSKAPLQEAEKTTPQYSRVGRMEKPELVGSRQYTPVLLQPEAIASLLDRLTHLIAYSEQRSTTKQRIQAALVKYWQDFEARMRSTGGRADRTGKTEPEVILTKEEYRIFFEASGALGELPKLSDGGGDFPYFTLRVLSDHMGSVIEDIEDRNREVLRNKGGDE